MTIGYYPRSEVRIAHSRDGLNWAYIGGDRAAWLKRGPSSRPPDGSMAPMDAWDGGMVAAVRGVVRRGDGLLRMYKWGTGRTHGQCQIGGPVDIPKGVACHHCTSV